LKSLGSNFKNKDKFTIFKKLKDQFRKLRGQFPIFKKIRGQFVIFENFIEVNFKILKYIGGKILNSQLLSVI
jgi:hypothetical protein